MKSINSHIKLIDQIKQHPSLDNNIRSNLIVNNSFLSMDYIAHYGEIIDCMSVNYNNIINIGVGHLFDNERTYNVFRISFGQYYRLVNSIDSLISELNALVLPNDKREVISNNKNKSVIEENQYTEYSFTSYTTYIRKMIESVLKDEYDLSIYYNRKFNGVRHLQFVRARPRSIPYKLEELSHKLPIHPYIKNGYINVAFDGE